jgi:hypothetical protein
MTVLEAAVWLSESLVRAGDQAGLGAAKLAAWAGSFGAVSYALAQAGDRSGVAGDAVRRQSVGRDGMQKLDLGGRDGMMALNGLDGGVEDP